VGSDRNANEPLASVIMSRATYGDQFGGDRYSGSARAESCRADQMTERPAACSSAFLIRRISRSRPSREPTLTHALSCADPAPAAAERSIGAIGRIERAVETGADINVALLLAEQLT
jgi:hypothetical protein